MSVPVEPRINLRVHLTEVLPIGNTWFPAWYFDFLRDLAHLPWRRIPETRIQAIVKMCAMRRKKAINGEGSVKVWPA